MKRKDFFKFIPLVIVSPLIVLKAIEEEKKIAKVFTCHIERGWIQVQWKNIKKGMVIKIEPRYEECVVVNDASRGEDGVWWVEIESNKQGETS